jgi:hypothetical protein
MKGNACFSHRRSIPGFVEQRTEFEKRLATLICIRSLRVARARTMEFESKSSLQKQGHFDKVVVVKERLWAFGRARHQRVTVPMHRHFGSCDPQAKLRRLHFDLRRSRDRGLSSQFLCHSRMPRRPHGAALFSCPELRSFY